ncbi:MAG: ABC transporter permease [Acidobacteriota bacterium]|jgi:sodium transport system permease protein
MNTKIITTVYRKEMLDLLRDRRTILSMIALPVLVFPLLFAVMTKFIGQAEKKAETEATTLAVGRGAIPAEFAPVITRSGLKPIEVEDVAVAVRESKASAGLRVSGDAKTVTVYAEGTRQSSRIAAEKLQAQLGQLIETRVAASLREAKLDPGVLKPFLVKRENVASERKMGGFLLGSMLGYIVILLMFSGGMYAAIDMAAGEKERKTLEALLASPARRTDLVLGKILACVTATYATALLTTGSLFASLKSNALDLKGMEKLVGSNVPTDAVTISLVLATLLPVAIMAGALMLAIALLARSFKEAQSYLTPLVMMVIFPALLGGLPGMELTPVISLVPILNSSQLLKLILQGETPLSLALLTNAANVVYAALCFAIAARSFNDEKVLYRT